MKLAEALIERADLQKRLAQLERRMQANAKVQEGDESAVDMAELFMQYEGLMANLEKLIQRINHTNHVTPFGNDTIAAAIAERDCLRAKIRMYRQLEEAAIIQVERYAVREIKYVRNVDVAELEKKIDQYSKEFRQLDLRLQELNWHTELV